MGTIIIYIFPQYSKTLRSELLPFVRGHTGKRSLTGITGRVVGNSVTLSTCHRAEGWLS